MGVVMLVLNAFHLPSSYIWDKKEQVYKYKSGELVPKTRIDKLFQSNLELLKKRNSKLLNDLYSKELSFDNWRKETFINIKYAEINTFLLKTGGPENISKKDIKILNGNLKKKFEYFSKFTQDIKNGISKVELEYRLKRYNESVYSALSTGDLLNKIKTGNKFAYRILGAAEHCNDCINYASLGVVPIEQFIPVKTNCVCQERCKCTGLFFESLLDATQSFNNR